MTCKLAAGNTRTKNTVNSQLPRNGEKYLSNNHTVCVIRVPSVPEPIQTALQIGTLPRSPNVQSSMCLKNH